MTEKGGWEPGDRETGYRGREKRYRDVRQETEDGRQTGNRDVILGTADRRRGTET